MTREGWVLAPDVRRLGGMVTAARGMGGGVTVLAVGPRSVADAAAHAGADRVAWIEAGEDVPAEAYASAVAPVLADAAPRAVLATPTPEGRALLGAVAAALDAVLVTGVVRLALEGDAVVAERAHLGGGVLETLASTAPVAGLFGGEDVSPSPDAQPAPVDRLDSAATPADLRVERDEPASDADAGVSGAERVVAVGRGLKAKADLALVEELAGALRAELACSMPVADDLAWLAKERYVGRSGLHIAPRLYLAIGISGAPQHMEGVREARVVVAVNDDPDARIFRSADLGIVGDLYDVVPALLSALGASSGTDDTREKAHG